MSEAPALPRRLESPLVGRGRELAELRRTLADAAADRAVQLVTVLGAAGVGKSRLAQELVSPIGHDATVLVGRCPSYGDGIAFAPLREIVREAVGEETRAGLLRLLAGSDDAEVVAARAAAALDSSGPAGSREETLWAFRRLFETIARERPLLLVLEDLHWAEPTLLDLVEYLAGSTRASPIFLLCLARPELLETRPTWAAAAPHAATLVLDPLDEESARTLVTTLTGGAELPGEAAARILAAAEGNPLFLEQMLAMLADEERPSGQLAFPTTIRAVLAGRLDRLGPAERAVVERAAVAGREFRPEAVAALLPVQARASLRRHLETLVRKEYLRSEPSGESFRFRHALIQEAAYGAVAKELRAELHERLAGWLEGELGEQIGEFEAVAGSHLERAFRYREELHAVDGHARALAARAADRLSSAGRRALERDDTPAAASLLGRAVALLEEGNPKRLGLLPDLVSSLREVPDLPRAAATAEEAVAAAAAAGDRRTEALARIERAHVRLMHASGGAVGAALAEAERALAVFEELEDDHGLGRAWRLVALAQRLLGHQSARRESLERALVHVRRTGDRRTEAWIYDGLGGVHNYGPSSVQELLAFAEESLRWAREHGQRFSEAHALAQGFGRSYAMLGDFGRARAAVEEARAIVEDLAFAWHRAGFASAAGFVEMLAGDTAAAERELRAGLDVVERAGLIGSYFGMGLRDELAAVLYAQGRHAEARELVGSSEREAPLDDVQAQVLWRGLRAKLLARDGRLDEAEALAREAAALAERTELLIVHANALLDLVEVLRLAGRPDDAAAAAAGAGRLFERKGDRVSAARCAALVAELAEVALPAGTVRSSAANGR